MALVGLVRGAVVGAAVGASVAEGSMTGTIVAVDLIAGAEVEVLAAGSAVDGGRVI